ncbi:galactose-binding domain-containing protein [Saccharicrinis sp. GN24d3]|uniref:galactose-binding domain-containing protein n=1 Tax=Saccharicrinis sp. GN24d3 TaxID=3458416 RepID=UPI004036FF0A
MKQLISMIFVLVSFTSIYAQSTVYTNDMDYVLGDVKQAFITNSITTEAQADNLIKGMKNLGVNGIRIPIYAAGLNPNKTMFDYFYNKAVAEGFPIFANPAQSSGGHRIANGILNGDLTSVLNDATATNTLINRIKDFAAEYPCKWINPFNEDGRPDAAWSTSQMNTIYASLYNNVNGAELIGPCVWGIPASIDVFNNTTISNYITVAATHNLGFNHSSWPSFISAADAKNLPVWDSEVNHNDAKGNGTRLEKALQYEVDGLVLYNIWNTVSLTDGSINRAGDEIMTLCLKNYTKGVNLALNGTATQSSTNYSSPASRAIDGNTNGNWGSGSVTVTNSEANAWWQVDLGADKTIGDIRIYNRTDACCKDRMSNFTVSVINSSGTTTHTETFTDYPDFAVTTNAGNVQGQIIKVKLNVTNALTLAEVEVYQGDVSNNISSPLKSVPEIMIYPNPASSFFTIKDNIGATFEVYNSLGRLVLGNAVESNQYRVDIQDLTSGIYLVKINNRGEVSNHKVIKQ